MEIVNVTLAARPSAAERNNTNSQASATGVTLGIQGINVDNSIASQMNLPSGQEGVLVEQVQPGSLADTAGLRAGSNAATINGQQVMLGGDIITAVNGQSVATIQDLKNSLSQLASDQKLSLTILRNGTELQISILPGQ